VEVKEVARRILAAGPVAGALRAVNANQRLSDRARSRLYHRVTKKIPPRPDQVFTYRVPGGEAVRFHLDGTIRRLHWTGAYEVDALPLFAAYARDASLILDVGAAEGVYSLFAAAVNDRSRILAFEPGSRQLVRLAANLDANAALVGDRLQIVTKALSDEDGTAEFHELPGGTSSLNAEFRANTESRIVELARGDDVVAELAPGARVDLIKIDTESTEPAVLRGLDATVRRDRPVIFCEVLSGRTESELQPLTDDWGYRTWWLSGDGPVRRDRIEGDPSSRFVNWLFLPDDRDPLTA
jgi:FkbM family methyltransferase